MGIRLGGIAILAAASIAVFPVASRPAASAVPTTSFLPNAIGRTMATIVLSANGAIEWGPTAAYTRSTPTGRAHTLLPLTPGTVYHYRVAVYGPVPEFGADQTLQTLPAAAPQFIGQPRLTTNTTCACALFAFTLDQGGLDTAIWVEYGTTAALGQSTPPNTIMQSLGDGARERESGIQKGLTGGTTYHYALVASNGAGTGRTATSTFTLPQQEAAPATQAPPTIAPMRLNVPAPRGSATVGGRLTAPAVKQFAGLELSYRWQVRVATGKSWLTLAGKKARTLQIVRNYAGKRLRVVITGTKRGLLVGTASSAPVAATRRP